MREDSVTNAQRTVLVKGSAGMGNRILAFDEGPDFTASVVTNAKGVRRLLIDGFTATSEDEVSAHYMQWMGMLPTLLHDDPKRGLVICFGTGQTANALRHSRLKKVDVVEISLAVLQRHKDEIRDGDLELMVRLVIYATHATVDNVAASDPELLGTRKLEDEISLMMYRYLVR